MASLLRETMARPDDARSLLRAELGVLAAELAVLLAQLAVELAIGRVDDAGGLRNSLGRIVRQAVQRVVFTHVFEEIFLRPSGKHGGRHRAEIGAVVGGQDGGLMAALGQFADLAQPQLAGQEDAAFGQLPGRRACG